MKSKQIVKIERPLAFIELKPLKTPKPVNKKRILGTLILNPLESYQRESML